jgi:hypothetical protein
LRRYIVALAAVLMLAGCDPQDTEDTPRTTSKESAAETAVAPETAEETAAVPETVERTGEATPDYDYEELGTRQIGDVTVVDVRLNVPDPSQEDLRAIAEELRQRYEGRADALHAGGPWGSMWILMNERAEETFSDITTTSEYRDGVAVYLAG